MRATAPLCVLGTLAVLAAACTRAPEPLTIRSLAGAWSGSMTHEGDEQPFALELEPAEDGTVALRLTIPAMNMSRQPAGSLEPQIEGRTLTLGPFVFTHDIEADTLSGTMPAGLVPVYDVPVTLRRVDAVESFDRAERTAPLVEPAWSFDVGAPAWPGATFAYGVVYAGSDAGRIHALDAASGDERWSFTAGGPIRTRVTVAGGAVYFQADDGVLYRLDEATGRETWQVRVVEEPIDRRPLTDPESRYDSFGSDVTVAEGRLFLGTHDGRVVAVDPTSGAVEWEVETDGSVLGAPGVAGGRVYAGTFGGQVLALDAATGETLWAADTHGAIVSAPAVADGLVIVGNRAYDIVALKAETGEVAWKRYVWFSWVESPATVRDGVVYIGSSDAAAAFALTAETGAPRWKADVFGWAWGQPAVTDERVFVQTAAVRGYQGDAHRGGVVALDRESGEAVWRYAVERPDEGAWGFPGSPAVGAGRVFVTGLDGRVLAFAQ